MSQSIITDINKISRSFRKANRERMEQLGIKGKYSHYFRHICNNPGVSQDSLVNSLMTDKGNGARDLAWLEEEGYIERKPSSEDRRISLIYPTSKGMEINEEISKFYSEWENALLEGLSEEEKDEIKGWLDKLVERVEQI